MSDCNLPMQFGKPKQDYRKSFMHNKSKQMSVFKYFDKKFTFSKSKMWRLPTESKSGLFNGEVYTYPSLQKLKNKLNYVKSKLNDVHIEEWSAHTRRRNPAGEVQWRLKSEYQAEFVTQAWCKMYECLCAYPITPNLSENTMQPPYFNSVHLCEAPGAFVAALNHYLKLKYGDQLKWAWLATTLNPYYEGNDISAMISDDRLLLHTLENWHFGNDFTGNIMDRLNIESLKRRCTELGPIMLVTADGSIDCFTNPEEQESNVTALHLCEVICALNILNTAGSFVLKMFTFYESTSVHLLYLLNCTFESVSVFKPVTSKAGNSEVYVICLGFKCSKNIDGYVKYILKNINNKELCSKAIFRRENIPGDFIQQIEKCSKYFMQLQINTIENNIIHFKIDSLRENKRIRQLRYLVANHFIDVYKVAVIKDHQQLLHSKNVNCGNLNSRLYSGSHNERLRLQSSTREDKLLFYKESLSNLKLSYSWTCEDPIKWVEFDPREELVLNIVSGKLIEYVNSSRFVTTPVLRLFQSVTTEFEGSSDEMYLEALSYLRECEIVLKFTFIKLDEAMSNYKTYDGYEKMLFRKLNNMRFQKGENVAIFGYPSLTQFAVGCLFILGKCYFEKIAFVKCGCILLFNFKNNCNYLNGICSFHESKKNSLEEHSQSVLSVVSMEQLCFGDFYTNLLNYNNFKLLKECEVILNTKIKD